MARPRDPEVDTKILEATRRLLERGGFESLTMDGIAGEAGVGKPTIYRRYRSKEQVVLALNISDSAPAEPVDTGSLAGDIAVIAGHTVASLLRMSRAVAGTQIGLAIADEAASSVFLESMAHTSGPAMEEAWRRGVERGEVDPALDFLTAKVALGTSLIFSILLYRLDPDAGAVDQIVDQWVRGVRPQAP